jgi:hypothetical protein
MKRSRSAVRVIVAALVLGLLPARAGTAAGVAASTSAMSEAALGQFQSDATAGGAMGFYRDDVTNDLVVVVPASRRASFEVPNVPAGESVRVKTIDLDPMVVDQALNRLGAVGPGLTEGNNESFTYRFNPEVGKVVVAGSIDRDVMLDLLHDVSQVIEYRSGVAVVPASRNSMSAPFLGGAQAKRVGSPNAFDCTTGFAVRKTSNGLRYMLTAGHCGGVLSSWISPGSNQTIGAMKFRLTAGTDEGLIGDKTYQPAIYTGGAAGTASTVKGAANPVLNKPIYCYSGAWTLEQCTVTILSMSSGNCYGGTCYSSQMTFQQFRDCPVAGGDSGAPFYLDFDVGGFPYIRGIVTGYLSDHSECYGEYWTRISSGLGVTIVTG